MSDEAYDRVLQGLDGARRAGWAKYYEAMREVDDTTSDLRRQLQFAETFLVTCIINWAYAYITTPGPVARSRLRGLDEERAAMQFWQALESGDLNPDWLVGKLSYIVSTSDNPLRVEVARVLLQGRVAKRKES